MYLNSVFFLSWILSGSCNYNVETVKNIDLVKYQGKWYEIARLPFRPEKNLINITAEYTLQNDGKILVKNSGYHKSTGKLKTAVGKAYCPDIANTGRLKLRFFGVIYSDYLIIAADTIGYQWAIVTNKKLSLLWILSRSPQIDDQLMSDLQNITHRFGIDTSKLIKTIQK